MATLAALITAAIIKVAATDPAMDRENGPSADEARDAFTEALLKELGLSSGAVHAPISAPLGTPTKARTEEVPAAPKKAKRTKKDKEEEDVIVALTEAVAELSVEPKPKKAKTAPKKKEAEPVPAPVAVPASNAGAGAPPVVKKKPGPKPKAVKAEGPVNLEKLTPTHKKHLKAIAEELKVETRDKEFLAFANGMSAEEWSGKALDDHIRVFLTPTPPPLAPAPTEFLEVDFKGKEYLVDPETKFVYASSDDGVVAARDHVGVVGILEFAHMKI